VRLERWSDPRIAAAARVAEQRLSREAKLAAWRVVFGLAPAAPRPAREVTTLGQITIIARPRCCDPDDRCSLACELADMRWRSALRRGSR
jgi:hypothetical protein